MAGNIILPNLKNSALSNNDSFYGVWNLTRALKAAGWIYKASGDGTTKETTGNPILDTWGPGGVFQSVQLASQTGSAASITTVSVARVTITGLTGMTTSSVGHGLRITNATNAGNNGTFTIISFVSSSSVVVWNPSGVVENTGALAWTERVSGTGASIAASIGDEAILTGLSGLTTTISPGHLITITNASNGTNNGTFRISSVISATSCKIKNSAAVLETGSLIWVENAPTSDTYPTFTSPTAWINLQGPSTLKIPITVASTGSFVRGENVTQSTTGAQGEILGYLYDSLLAIGYLVVLPRVDGTGGGVHGWSSSNTITGAISGATVNAGGTVIEFVREFVFWKGSATLATGWIAYQCIDQSAENASRFSFLAGTAAGVTASVPPGGGGTGNAFPSLGTMICIGATVSTATQWDMQSTNPSVCGRQQIIAVNAVNSTNMSADGSFFMVMGRPDLNSQYCTGWGFTRCDNSEDGDVDPYVWYSGNGGGNYTGTRTSCLSGGNVDMWSTLNANLVQSQGRGFRRRGFTTFDTFQQFTLAGVTGQINNNNNSYWALNINTQDNDSVACTFSPTKVREPLFVLSIQLGQKMRKGTCRWIFATAGGSNMDTYDNRTWIQISSNTGGNAGSGPYIIGPWDGLSNPLQA